MTILIGISTALDELAEADSADVDAALALVLALEALDSERPSIIAFASIAMAPLMSMVTDLAFFEPAIASSSLMRSSLDACDAADDADADADADADPDDAADEEAWLEQPASITADSASTHTATKYFLIPFIFLPFLSLGNPWCS